MTGAIIKLDLMQFCDPDRALPVTQCPHRVHGDKVLATDGKIAVVVGPDVFPLPDFVDTEAGQEAGERALKVVDGYFDGADGLHWKLWPGVSTPERDRQCGQCGGTGHATLCLDCSGFGEQECECCGHVSECDTCDGEGNLPADEGTKCGDCDGTGKTYPPITERAVELMGLHFDPLLLNKLSGFPDLQVTSIDRDCGVLLFRFSGGYGVVMPVHV